MGHYAFQFLVLLVLVRAMAVVEATPPGIAKNPSHATCKIKKYKHCYNLVHVCPKFCPDNCTVECASCKPICVGGSNPPPEDSPYPPPPATPSLSPPPSETYPPPSPATMPPPPSTATPSPPVTLPPSPPNSPSAPSPAPATPRPPITKTPPPSPPTPSTPNSPTPPALPVTPSPPTVSSPPSPPSPPATSNPQPPPHSPPTPSPMPPNSPPPSLPSPTPSPPPPSTSTPSAPNSPTPPTATPTSSPPPATPPPTPGSSSTPWPPPATTPSLPPPPTSTTPSSPQMPHLSPPPTSPSPSTPGGTPAPSPPTSSAGARKRARCRNVNYPQCYNMIHTCPSTCPDGCEVDCVTCKAVCKCDRPGAVCQDPRFIGGDGITFYFHGKKGRDFCLVSDHSLHINAHLIGKRNQNLKRDFTWVQSLGILFDNHRLFIGAQETVAWDDSVDRISVALNGQPITLPEFEGSQWQYPAGGSPSIFVVRLAATNNIMVEAKGLFRITAKVVPITEEDSRIHNYGITKDNSFAHLDVGFKFFSLSSKVGGVLGQTYSPEYTSRINIKAKMPVMGRDEEFEASSLFATDCAVAKFRGGHGGSPEDA